MSFTPEQKQMFEEAYEKAKNTTVDSKLVGLSDLMLKLLVESGQADVTLLHPLRVVPHNKNRGGALMEYRKMFSKFSKILGVGYSKSKCDPSRAVCFQKMPGAKMNFIQHANSCPYFATFDEQKVDAGSVGCGHLNQGLAAAIQNVRVPPEFETDADLVGNTGKKHIDRHDICSRDEAVTRGKDLENTLDVGLKWTYIYAHVEECYPMLPDIFQKALNWTIGPYGVSTFECDSTATWSFRLNDRSVSSPSRRPASCRFINVCTVVDFV